MQDMQDRRGETGRRLGFWWTHTVDETAVNMQIGSLPPPPRTLPVCNVLK